MLTSFGPLILLDPGSLAFDYSEEFGYKLVFRRLEDYIKGMSMPSWHQWISYETKSLDRAEIANLTIELIEHSISLREKYGIYDRAQALRERIYYVFANKLIMKEVEKAMRHQNEFERQQKLKMLKEMVDKYLREIISLSKPLDVHITFSIKTVKGSSEMEKFKGALMNRPDIRRLPKRVNPREAQGMLLKSVSGKIPRTETVPLEACIGRILAIEVFSNLNIPSYDKAFIDGYAIIAKDTQTATITNPAIFKIAGKLFPADYPTTVQVHPCEAIYVACGAPIPRGATATVKVEETRLRQDTVEVVRKIKAGEGIIPLGDDVKKGALILKKGQLLRPQDIGILASIRMTHAKVFKKPVVSIISGGDELIKQCQTDPATIANNYALVVAGLSSELGAAPKLLGIMPDDLDKVTEKIHEALGSSDIIVTIGGSSVGVKDFIPDAVNALGKPGVVVQGILLRPGAISGFGLVDDKPVIMLPGHIGSCIAGFYVFVAPLISTCNGLNAASALPQVNAKIGEAIENGPQFRFLLVHLTRLDGEFIAEPTEGGSSALTTIVKSNGYTIIPPHAKLEKGANVEVVLFNRLEITHI